MLNQQKQRLLNIHLKPCQATIPQWPRTGWVSTKLVCTNNPLWGALPCRLGRHQKKKGKKNKNTLQKQCQKEVRNYFENAPNHKASCVVDTTNSLTRQSSQALTWAMMGERAPAIWGSEVLRDCIWLPGHKREAVICNKALHLMFKSWWFYSVRSKNFLPSVRKIWLKFTQFIPYIQALAHLVYRTQKPVLQYVDSILLHTTKPNQSTKKPLSPSNKQNTQPNI